jgi:glycosyltransferase involved in cell wall biosynthesis
MSRHVAMILQSYYPRIGGAERQVASLAPLLRTRGFQVTVITRQYPGLKPFENIAGTPVYRIPVPGPKAIASLAFTLGALLKLTQLKPDIIHAHELLSPTTTALAAKKLFNTPIIVKVLRGGLLGDIAKLKKRRNAGGWLKTMSEQVNAFVAISAEIERELIGAGIPTHKIRHIANGVDTELFQPAQNRLETRKALGVDENPVIIYAGRLDPEKRLDLALQAWSRVGKNYPQAGFLLVGAGSSENMLRQIPASRVNFVGRVDVTAPYLQAADIFILPSESEGLSNSLLEAMSTGLAVLATDVGGVRDVIIPGKSGFIIPPNDEPALENGLRQLLADPTLRERLGKSARERILTEFSLASTADKLAALYQSLL